MKTRTLLLATIAALALPMQGQTLLNDSFTDSEFLTQSLPNSAEWFRSLNAVSAANQNFAVTGLSGGITVAGFFGNTPHTLSNPGDGITLSFTFTTPNDPLLSNTGNGFRFALFNSAGDRFNTESGVTISNGTSTGTATTGNGPYYNWTGYAGFLSPNGGINTGGNFGLYQRYAGVNSSLFANSAAYNEANVALTPGTLGGTATATALTTTPRQNLSPNTVYNFSLSILKQAEGNLITASVSGGGLSNYTISYLDNTTVVLNSFDTVGIYAANNALTAFTLDNISVTAIPEPSTYALLLGMAALGAGALIRRRRR
jgi:hypothetical protein